MSASAAQVDTCGVRFPRRMSDAHAFEHPIASTIRPWTLQHIPFRQERGGPTPASWPLSLTKVRSSRASMRAVTGSVVRQNRTF